MVKSDANGEATHQFRDKLILFAQMSRWGKGVFNPLREKGDQVPPCVFSSYVELFKVSFN